MNQSFNPKKIRWKCRRGMLELDILFDRFYEKQFHILTSKEKEMFNKLLDYPDPLLYNWLLGHTAPKSLPFKKLIQKIQLPT